MSTLHPFECNISQESISKQQHASQTGSTLSIWLSAVISISFDLFFIRSPPDNRTWIGYDWSHQKLRLMALSVNPKVFLRTPAPFHTKPQGLKSGWRWSEFSFDRPSIDPYFNDQEGEKPFSPTVALSTQLPNLLLAPACCGGLSIWSNSCRNQHHRHNQKHPTRTAEWVKTGSYVGGYEG